MSQLTQSELSRMIQYDPDTGVFIWLEPAGTKMKKGDRAGGAKIGHYSEIKIRGKSYKAHRLAWLYVHGRFPDGCIDHINGDPSDNRLCNLREASHAENLRNTKKQKSNSTGYKGVSWHQRDRRYQANISVNQKRIYLGSFLDPEQAYAAYCKASKEYHGEFGRAE